MVRMITMTMTLSMTMLTTIDLPAGLVMKMEAMKKTSEAASQR